MTDDIRRIFDLQKAKAPDVGRATLRERKRKLRSLSDAILLRRDGIRAALAEDLGKSPEEADLSEIYFPIAEARHARRHLGRWSRKRVPTTLPLLGSASEIRYQPKGVVLIVAPWNFPFNLSVGPLVSAIAAGNCAILKPSELAPATSRCIRTLLAEVFEESEVAVIEGDASVAQALIALPFDHIFFTGGSRVGKVILSAAAENLTPVTLELGGKSPTIVDQSADLDEAAKKIAWGKYLNNGQTCIAPDYVLVHESVAESFTEKLIAQTEAIWGPRSELSANADYGRIVSTSHHRRLRDLLDSTVAGGGEVLAGGASSEEDRFFAPTIVGGVPAECDLRSSEIFGPILPVDTFANIDEAIARIVAADAPLALYIFSRNRTTIEKVISETRAGGTVVNDALIHFYQHYLPFGGVGASGMGRGHGEAGFQTFSNARGVMRQRSGFGAMQLLYPPYTSLKRRLIDFMIRYL